MKKVLLLMFILLGLIGCGAQPVARLPYSTPGTKVYTPTKPPTLTPNPACPRTDPRVDPSKYFRRRCY